jgi:protein tyrosine phosphatase (PTP) superfamily phosphohydrolase (DUF442 family)
MKSRNWQEDCFRQKRKGSNATEIGSYVRLPVHSVFLPCQDEVRRFADGDEELDGIVLGFSDSGGSSNAYAVVEVKRTMSLVVPIHALKLITDP